MKKIPYWGIGAVAALLTVIFWIHPDGSLDYIQYISDGITNFEVRISTPRPLPPPPIVHPYIESAGTPSPYAKSQLPL